MKVNVRWTFNRRKDNVFSERSMIVVTERLTNVDNWLQGNEG